MNQKTLQDLRQEIKFSTLDELGYLLGRYCGPHNRLLREKIYDYEACKAMMRLINDEIAIRSFDQILMSDS